jgi:ribosomal protein L5
MEFKISSLGIFMIQKTYLGKILKQFGMMSNNPTKLPMIEGTKLETNMGKEEIDATQYRQAIGKLIYLTNSKLDIVYAVNVVNRFMARP